MKKMTFLVLGLFLILGTSSVVAYDNLYLVGNASPAGWNTVENVQNTMTNEGGGIFTWTGTLLSKDAGDGGQMRFKFRINAGLWDPSLTCTASPSGNRLVNPGEEYELRERAGGDPDNAFQVAETGTYIITINTNTMKMVIQKEGSSVPGVDNLYIVGSASYAEWDPGKSHGMTKVSDGVFTWTGILLCKGFASDGNARFKFLVAKDWHPSYTCQIANPGHTLVTPGEDYDLYKRENGEQGNDNAFMVAGTGTYTVNVNLNTMKMLIQKDAALEPSMDNLFIVGDATDAGWNDGNAIQMEKISDGVFKLATSIKAGTFKFLSAKSWSNSINPVGDGDIAIEVDKDYNLKYRPQESTPGDNKFSVSGGETGNYFINVDLNEMKMRITTEDIHTGLSAIISEIPFEIVASNGAIDVIATNNNEIQSVKLFDLSGKAMNGKNLSTGVYIVKVKCNNEEYVQKVMMK